MPGFLVHVGATVVCAHQAQAAPNQPNPRVRVAGKATVLQSGPYSITACPFHAGPPPSPCMTATWSTAALRVKSRSVALVLKDSMSTCVPNGTPLTINSTQTRVKAQ